MLFLHLKLNIFISVKSFNNDDIKREKFESYIKKTFSNTSGVEIYQMVNKNVCHVCTLVNK